MDGLALTLAVVYVMRRATRAAALGLNNKLKFCHAFHVPSSCVGAPLSRRGPQRALFRSLGSDGRAAQPPPVTTTVVLVRPSVRPRPPVPSAAPFPFPFRAAFVISITLLFTPPLYVS